MAYYSGASAAAAAQAQAMEQMIISNLLKFFRSKDALSEHKAVAMDHYDWLEIGVDITQQNIFFNTTTYLAQRGVKKIGEDRYWLDLQLFDLYRERMKRFNTIMLGVALAIIALTLVFTFVLIIGAFAVGRRY